MTQSFRCPSCNAPLKFQKGLVQTCKFCGSDVLVPTDVSQPEEKIEQTKPPVEAEPLRDASALGQKALKIAEIKHALREKNRTTSAAILFRDSFGGSIADAREIIKAIESGESINIPDIQTGQKPSIKPSWRRRIILFAILSMAVIILIVFIKNLFR